MLLRRVEGGWAAPSLTNYANEDELQSILAGSPELVPGAAGTAAVREFQVPLVGAVDVVCVSADGDITLVECKLATNADMRRTVVGQILAYASGIQGMTFEDFASRFEARAGKSLLAAVSDAAGREIDGQAFRADVETRLADGAFRLVFAVDSITNELRSIVEYLHRHLSASVPIVALELGYLKVQEADQFLVPITYGAELAEEKATSSTAPGAKRRWSRTELDEAVKALPDSAVRSFIDGLVKHASEHGGTIQGGVGRFPSAGVYYQLGQKRPSLWSIYVGEDWAKLALNLGSINGALPSAAAHVLALLRKDDRFNDALPPDDETALTKYPEYQLAGLTAAGVTASDFCALLDVALETSPGVPPLTPT